MAVAFSDSAPVVCVNFPGYPYALDDLLELVEAAEWKTQDGSRPLLVVLARETPDGQGRRLGHLVRGLAYRSDVALVTVRASASAANLIRWAVLSLAGQVDIGLVPVLAHRLSASVQTVAVVDSVSKLTNATATVTQHARSYLPGSCFVISPGRPVVTGRTAGLMAWQALVASMAGALGQSTAMDSWPGGARDFAGCLPQQAPLLDSAWVSSGDWWGAKKWIEVSWIDQDASQIAWEVSQAWFPRCSNCGQPVDGTWCPFCRVANYGTAG